MGGRNKKTRKIEVKDTGKYGLGLFAAENIKKGEIVADYSNDTVYESKVPNEIADYALQFEEHKWVYPHGIGRYINHSCEPNCGVSGTFKLVAMRDINKGEELTFDYEMTEDSDWRMECQCGSESCRKIIGAYSNMPELVRQKYKGYISDWLVKKYRKA